MQENTTTTKRGHKVGTQNDWILKKFGCKAVINTIADTSDYDLKKLWLPVITKLSRSSLDISQSNNNSHTYHKSVAVRHLVSVITTDSNRMNVNWAKRTVVPFIKSNPDVIPYLLVNSVCKIADNSFLNVRIVVTLLVLKWVMDDHKPSRRALEASEALRAYVSNESGMKFHGEKTEKAKLTIMHVIRRSYEKSFNAANVVLTSPAKLKREIGIQKKKDNDRAEKLWERDEIKKIITEINEVIKTMESLKRRGHDNE